MGTITADQAAEFQSTLPAGGATNADFAIDDGYAVSIHAPRRGSDLALYFFGSGNLVSIHAPRRGSDIIAPRRGSL